MRFLKYLNVRVIEVFNRVSHKRLLTIVVVGLLVVAVLGVAGWLGRGLLPGGANSADGVVVDAKDKAEHDKKSEDYFNWGLTKLDGSYYTLDYSIPGLSETGVIKADASGLSPYIKHHVAKGVKTCKVFNTGEDYFGGEVENSGFYCTMDVNTIKEMRGKRKPIEIDPYGFPGKNPRVEGPDGKHFYLFNRSHLIAVQLGGENYGGNMITGTRFQNVGNGNGGMRIPESETVKAAATCNGDGVYFYSAHPIYDNETDPGKAKWPKAVDVRSTVICGIPSDGDVTKGRVVLNRSYRVMNVQPGFAINYSQGKWEVDNAHRGNDSK